jgi:hypothetical protein
MSDPPIITPGPFDPPLPLRFRLIPDDEPGHPREAFGKGAHLRLSWREALEHGPVGPGLFLGPEAVYTATYDEPSMWPTLADLEQPVSARERAAADGVVTAPTFGELTLIDHTNTSFGVVRNARAAQVWASQLFADAARPSLLFRFAGPPRSPDLWRRGTPKPPLRARLRTWWARMRWRFAEAMEAWEDAD